MITPMLKYNFLLYRADLNDFLNRLQEAEMLHIEAESVEPDEETAGFFQKAEKYDKIYSELKTVKIEPVNPEAKVVEFIGDADVLAEKYLEIKDRQEKLNAAIKKLEKDIEEALPWGDFNEENIERITKLGIKPKFYCVAVKQFVDEWANRYPLCEINRENGKVYFIILQDDTEFDFELQEVKAPARSYRSLLDEMAELDDEYEKCSAELQILVPAAGILSNARKHLLEKIDFNIARLSSHNEADGSLKLLTGWLQKENREKFEAFLENCKVLYFVKEEFDENDRPPILLKNNRFAKLFEPLTEFYSLPNYTELDPTAFIAPFFMMFFGFCLGDGGYGLFILLVASLLKLKIKDKQVRVYLSLAQCLGFGTLMFGFITASFLGIEIEQIKLDKMAEEALNLPKNYGMLCLSLVLGFLQIIAGMSIKTANIVRRRGWKYALAELAWIIIIIVGLVLVAIGDTADKTLYNIVLGVFGLSLLVAFFYNLPEKNPFINFGSGLWTTYNVVSGLMGDILSYIRLFALGMTGGILGSVFNTLAVDAGSGIDLPVVSQLITVIILVFGHCLNFMLGALGAMIHPIRLTFVEFYKNIGFEGGGVPFKLFKKMNIN